MTLPKIFSIGLIALALPTASLATSGLTPGEASAKHSLRTYGYGHVDVTQLNATQLAQIHYLAGSDSGAGRIRGQIGAILRRSHIWNLTHR